MIVMSILDAEHLSKTYGDRTLFDNISFTISERERIGLIGVNGTGKSSLLNVLAGQDSSEGGTIRHANDFQLTYLPQHPAFHSGVTAIDYIYAGSSPVMTAMRHYEAALHALDSDPENPVKQAALLGEQQHMDASGVWEAESAAKNILERLGIHDYGAPVADMSGGQKKRVALARALIQPADLLLLDEPTNHLDSETIEWLEEALARYSGALLIVTHDRYFLNRVTRKIFELDHGRLFIYKGNYEYFLEKKIERKALEQADAARRRNQLRREVAWLKRGAKARTTKQKARVERVHRLQAQKDPETKQSLEIEAGAARLGKKVIEASGVSKRLGDRTLISGLDLLITPGERIGIVGRNGSGKTTLLNLLAGRLAPDAGTIETGDTVKIGYYTQEQQEMDESLRVIDYIKEERQVMTTADGRRVTAEQMLERFLFSRPRQYTYIGRLSGGERKRLYLLRLLMREPNVLLLDEPTNDLDTETLTTFEDYLLQFPGTVVAVSHDRYFLDRVVDRLLVFGDGSIHKFEGTYSAYAEVRKEKEARSAEYSLAAGSRPTNRSSERKPGKKKKLTYKEQQEWAGIEDRITALEQEVVRLKQAVTDAGSDAEKAQELFARQQQLEQELDQAMDR